MNKNKTNYSKQNNSNCLLDRSILLTATHKH